MDSNSLVVVIMLEVDIVLLVVVGGGGRTVTLVHTELLKGGKLGHVVTG